MSTYFAKEKENTKPRFDIFSLGVGAVAFYFVFFLFVPLLQAMGVDVGAAYVASLSREAWTVIGAGFVGLLGGYLALPRAWVRRVPDIFAGVWDYRRAAWVVGILAVLGGLGKIARVLGGGYFHTERSAAFLSSPFASVVGYLDWAWLIAFGVALLAHYSLLRGDGLSAKPWGVLAGTLFGAEAVFSVFSCGREEMFLILLSYLIIRWYAKGLAWWKVILMLLIAVAIIFPFGNICRNPVMGERFLSEIQHDNSPVSFGKNGIQLAAGSFISRINHSVTVSHVVDADLSDFKSKFFRDVFVNLGPPRFLWPNKPVSINARGNEFGHRIGVLAPDDQQTSVGPTLPGDLFINFGLIGILAGMALFGSVLKFLSVYLLRGGVPSLSGVLIYTVAWLQLLRGIEGWTVPLIAGFLKIFILLFVIHFVITRRTPAFTST